MKRLEMVMTIILLGVSFVLFYVRGEDVSVAIQGDREENSSYVVVLDAGHGASDSGKVGIHGELEKDINLAIVNYLKKELEENGVTVILTRENDTPLYKESDSNKKLSDMKKRIEIIETVQPDIVVSIHQNSYTSKNVKGPQVFYYETSVEGEKLATAIQKSFDLVIGDENRRSIKGNKDYYLLIHTSCPIVITECGFLSNPEEEKLLLSQDYQEKVCYSILCGVIKYFG